MSSWIGSGCTRHTYTSTCIIGRWSKTWVVGSSPCVCRIWHHFILVCSVYSAHVGLERANFDSLRLPITCQRSRPLGYLGQHKIVLRNPGTSSWVWVYWGFTSHTPGIQKHVTMRNTGNRAKVHIGIIKGELYFFSNNKQCGHLPTANVYIHIEYYF